MEDLLQMNVSTPSQRYEEEADHTNREKKIENPTVARLLRSARRVVEDVVWKDGMVWYPNDVVRRVPATELTDFVFPDPNTPASRSCVQDIRDYTGEPFSEQEARQWLTEKIEERLYKYIIGARNKISTIRLVVQEEEVEIRAERPDTTKTTVGPAPWSPSL